MYLSGGMGRGWGVRGEGKENGVPRRKGSYTGRGKEAGEGGGGEY